VSDPQNPRLGRPLPESEEPDPDDWKERGRRHLSRRRPRLVAALQKAGQWEEWLEKQVDRAERAAQELQEKWGWDPVDADTWALKEYLLLPSEKAQPEFGGPVNREVQEEEEFEED
jgi:hypothetical protein